jgi:flagellar biosynthetic protein FlhB
MAHHRAAPADEFREYLAGPMSNDKTEKPTRRRRADARKKGQSARSAELAQAVSLVAAFVALPSVLTRLVDVLVGGWHNALAVAAEAGTGPGDTALATTLARATIIDAARAVLPLFVVVAVLSASVQFAVVGGRPNPYLLRPKLERLNPAEGIRRYVSKQIVWETLRVVLKLAAVTAVVLTGWNAAMRTFETPMSVGEFVTSAGAVSRTMFLRVAALAVVVGVVDAVLARRRHERNLRMTKQEAREELRQSEGDPHVKGEVRRRMVKLSRNRMMAEVARASVVLTNPTHVAVALRYDERSPAPIVVAKGAGVVAQRIREKATEHGVPIQENKPLARALFKAVEIGSPIPIAFYQAVAEVLAVVFRTRRVAS